MKTMLTQYIFVCNHIKVQYHSQKKQYSGVFFTLGTFVRSNTIPVHRLPEFESRDQFV